MRRTIAASADEVFDAWLDPESLAVWMRPMGMVSTSAQVDARVGGAFEIVMHRGAEHFRHTGTYLRIERPHLLKFTWTSDATRQTESLVTVELVPRGDATEIVVIHEKLPGDEAAASHEGGWTQALELLETSSKTIEEGG